MVLEDQLIIPELIFFLFKNLLPFFQYFKEKFCLSHFWELKGYVILFLRSLYSLSFNKGTVIFHYFTFTSSLEYYQNSHSSTVLWALLVFRNSILIFRTILEFLKLHWKLTYNFIITHYCVTLANINKLSYQKFFYQV